MQHLSNVFDLWVFHHERINFWGLHEGLDRTREYVTKHADVLREFTLWNSGETRSA